MPCLAGGPRGGRPPRRAPTGRPTTRRAALSDWSSSTWVRAESMVPPLNPPFRLRTARWVRPSSAPSARAASAVSQHPEVARDRVEAAGVDDAGAGALGGLVVGGDAAVHEEHLSGEVAVVRAGLGARGGRAARRTSRTGPTVVTTTRARSASSVTASLVRGVDHEQRPALARRAASPRATSCEPGQRAARERDAHVAGRASAARCRAVSRPTNPVAPNRTMSNSRALPVIRPP